MSDVLIDTAGAPLRPGSRSLDELDGYLRCTHIAQVTHDVKSFTFELPESQTLSFLPGQYLTFRFLIDGMRVERCYTVSSPATRPGQLQTTVKRVPGGPVSNWLHDQLRVGDAIGATGPLGQFTWAHHPAQKYLFLTAGSGITPAMSMMRTRRETAHTASVVFVHSARTPADIIYRDEIEAFAEDPGVTVAIVCEDDSPDEHWQGARGRLSLQTLLRAAPDLISREIFTCGPPPYMRAVRELLDALGVDPARAHEESFDLATNTPAGEGASETTGTTHRVHFRRTGRTVECDAATTILEAGRAAGIPLASSCEEGMCGTCKLTLLSGQVDMQHAGGIRPREIEQQKFLPCCSRPMGDVEVDA